MAIDENNIYDIENLQDLMLDDLDTSCCGSLLPSFNEFHKGQLYIPPDPLQDLELFPTSTNDFISLDILLRPEHDNLSSSIVPGTPKQRSGEKKSRKSNKRRRINEVDGNKFLGFECVSSKKKQRSIRPSGHAWSSSRDPSCLALSSGTSVEENRRMRCSHCQVEKTPQWRMGPLGPKTLCNACGVRYKSGRLLPEYRPAASPTFDGLKHSNFHRTILKQKGKDINWQEGIDTRIVGRMAL